MMPSIPWGNIRDTVLLVSLFWFAWRLYRHYHNFIFIVVALMFIAVPMVLYFVNSGQGFEGHYRKLGWLMWWIILVILYWLMLAIWNVVISLKR